MCNCSSSCNCNITALTKGEKGDVSSIASLGYKVYKATMSHSGTIGDNPTVTVLQNTLGVTPLWLYDSVGSYYADLISDASKTFLFINTPNFSLSQFKRTSNIYSDGGSAYIITSDGTVRQNGLLYNTSVLIEIHP